MFESTDGRHRPRRPVDPPRPVEVDLSRLYPPTRLRWGVETPMWVRSCGLQLRRPVPGVLREWWLTSVGDWVGLVDLTVEIDHQQVPMTLLVPAAAISQ